jgi:hypothetical protein
MTAKQIKNVIGHNKFDSYFKFSVIRNPYDKMVSRYFWIKKKGIFNGSFKQFVKNYNCKNLHIHSIDEKCICDFHIRFEHLEDDIKTVCEKLEIKEYNLNDLLSLKSNTRPNKKRNYRNMYDDEIRKIVYEKHEKEFKMFNYEF